MRTPQAPPYDPATQERTLTTGPGNPGGVWTVTDLSPAEIAERAKQVRRDNRLGAMLDDLEGKPINVVITSGNLLAVVRKQARVIVELVRRVEGLEMSNDQLGG